MLSLKCDPESDRDSKERFPSRESNLSMHGEQHRLVVRLSGELFMSVTRDDNLGVRATPQKLQLKKTHHDILDETQWRLTRRSRLAPQKAGISNNC